MPPSKFVVTFDNSTRLILPDMGVKVAFWARRATRRTGNGTPAEALIPQRRRASTGRKRQPFSWSTRQKWSAAPDPRIPAGIVLDSLHACPRETPGRGSRKSPRRSNRPRSNNEDYYMVRVDGSGSAASLFTCAAWIRIRARRRRDPVLHGLNLYVDSGDFVSPSWDLAGRQDQLLNAGRLDFPSAWNDLHVSGDEITPCRDKLRPGSTHVALFFQMYNRIPVLTAFQTVELPGCSATP